MFRNVDFFNFTVFGFTFFMAKMVVCWQNFWNVFLFFRLIPTRWCSKGNALFSCALARQDRPCCLASFLGRWTSSACLLLQNHHPFVSFWFWPWCCKANMFFHGLYIVMQLRTTLTATEGGSLLAEGFLRALVSVCIFPALHHSSEGPHSSIRDPFAVPSPPALSPRPFPPIYPRRAAPHQFRWKDPCLPPPKAEK